MMSYICSYFVYIINCQMMQYISPSLRSLLWEKKKRKVRENEGKENRRKQTGKLLYRCYSSSAFVRKELQLVKIAVEVSKKTAIATSTSYRAFLVNALLLFPLNPQNPHFSLHPAAFPPNPHTLSSPVAPPEPCPHRAVALVVLLPSPGPAQL